MARSISSRSMRMSPINLEPSTGPRTEGSSSKIRFSRSITTWRITELIKMVIMMILILMILMLVIVMMTMMMMMLMMMMMMIPQ